MLRILAGLEIPDSGAVLFNGRDVASLPAHERGAPMVFQNYALWPHLNVRDTIAFGLVERQIPRAEVASRVEDVLRRVGLDGLGARLPGQLSGGQQQRVVLARALVLNPAVILLDEPLSNLDAKLRVEMRQEIETLRETTEISFVYVTHDQADALALADRMAVMQAGQVSAVGTPLGLYARPPNVFCANFLGEANLVEGVGCGGKISTKLGMWELGGREASPRPPKNGEGRVEGVGVCGGLGEASLPNGQKYICLIRPENLQPVAGPAAGQNVFEAEITGLRMNGATVTVSLAAVGLDLKATVLTQNSLGLKKGDKGWWGVLPENVVLMEP